MNERISSRSRDLIRHFIRTLSNFFAPKLQQFSAANPSHLSNSQLVGQLSRICLLVGTSVTLTAILSFPADCQAQADRPKVVTMDTGVQFEGEVFTISKLSVTTAAFTPMGAARDHIVVIVDGLRRVFVGQSHVQNLGDSNQGNEISFDVYQRIYNGSEGIGTFVGVGPFDRYGHREFTIGVQTKSGTPVRRTYVQGITKITPRYCELKTLVGNDTAPLKQWTMYISTGTVPKDVLRNVLLSRFENPDKPDEYFDIAYLFQQMGDFMRASEELRQIETRFPDLKERIRDARDQLGQLRARQILREINLRKDSGQFDLALQMAQVKSKERLAGAILAEFTDLEQQELDARQQVEDTRRKVLALTEDIRNVNAEQSSAIKRFKDDLETDLNRFNEPRLAAYMRLADDASMPDQQKIALAISGWLLGSNNAIENLAVVQSMFTVRDLVREYLATNTTADRRLAIVAELGKYEAGAANYVDQMIQQMKPVDPPTEIDNYVGKDPIQFTVELPGTKANPDPMTFQCLAHLPPQYDPYRKYPLVLSLPGGIQTAEQNLQLWCGRFNEKLKIRQGHAMRNGYVVVSVDWREPGQLRWGYTGREHRVVLDALYHALRKFSIDSDRVFLSGHRDGGDGAYDIGISHPEHWAGVIGYSGKFGKYINKYWDNIHVPLPLYCVNGQKDVGSIGEMEFAINKWMIPKYVNPTIVHYLGRGNELFLEDLPMAFKWMRGQKRKWPDLGGFEFACSALRPWDTYYWFFEMHGLPEERVVRPELFDETKKFPKLEISGNASPGNKDKPNVFSLGPKSMKIDVDSTLWLSPQFADFSQRIEIRGRGSFKGFVRSSTKVILEDALRRADREHLYHARIDCIDGKWRVTE